ncbi:hypothetical protein HAX54_032832 [Datura stramonium]|uniref:Uncharacterized protein n=1 Tax=Datura stramonium TaxID=4076 RepID=A0ABS8VDV8_DATST|nr:hypothetical protein [Datura stramonium]
MAPKVNKGKGMASLSHGIKGQVELKKHPVRMQACHHNRQGFIGSIGSRSKKDVLRMARVKKGQRFSFGGLLTQILREQQIDEAAVDYRPRYDPKGLDVTKKKELDYIHGLVLSISERNACIDNVLSYLYSMQILQLRMNGVTEEQL